MRTRIVKIGNSRGIRIPKALLDETGLCGEVEIQAQGESLLIVAAHHPRAGWDDAFEEMVLHDDDRLLDGDVSTSESFDRGRPYPSRVATHFGGQDGQVVIDQLRTVDKALLVRCLGVLESHEAESILGVLREFFAP